MATTYAAYYNIATSSTSSRKPSSAPSANSTSSKSSTTSKIMTFLAPRIPVHEPLTPTAVAKKQQRELVGGGEREETHYAPARIYDSVMRRPLFRKARKGNEVTLTEKQRDLSSASTSKKSSVSESVDRVYDVHLSGGR